MKLHVFTSAALNYLPKVRRLVQSVRQFHPEAHITLALADLLPENLAPPAEFDAIVSVADLGIADWRGWTFGHTLVELATAIKPFVLDRLLAEDGARVIYLDPDTVLFDRLDDVLEALDSGASVALTPHLVAPESTVQGILDNEMAALKHGIYNLGFVAVAATPAGRAFAAWWRERCRQWCIDDIANGLFTDQRWIDLVPALFPEVAILRTPRLNVAPWNIGQRQIAERGGRYWVGGEPLGFYHFTGFDSGAHAVMAGRYGAASPAVRALIDDYRAFLRSSEQDELNKRPWAFASFAGGAPVPRAARRLYRARPDLQRAFPDPYREDFQRWWRSEGQLQPEPASAHAGGTPLLSVVRNVRAWPALARRMRRVLKDEGWAGVRRRLRRLK